jgi:hypothetical protein
MLKNQIFLNISKDYNFLLHKFFSLKESFLKISTFLQITELVSKLPRYYANEQEWPCDGLA